MDGMGAHAVNGYAGSPPDSPQNFVFHEISDQADPAFAHAHALPAFQPGPGAVPDFHLAPPPPPLLPPAPSSDAVSGGFDPGLFSTRYQRNNKRGGLKHLRCFPCCSWRHVQRGFCGRPVEATFAIPARMLPPQMLYVCAEFALAGAQPRFLVGQRASLRELKAQERTKEEPTRSFVAGELVPEKCGPGVAVFEFNKERRGWHYGWPSNKHTCDAEHALRCYLFEAVAPPGKQQQPSDELRCRHVAQSPGFRLFCRRRMRFTIEPSAPNAVVKKRPRSGSRKAGGAVSKRVRKPTGGDDDDDDEEEEDEEEVAIEEGDDDDDDGDAPPKLKEEVGLGSSAAAASSFRPLERARSSQGGRVGGGDAGKLERVFQRFGVLMSRIHQLENDARATAPPHDQTNMSEQHNNDDDLEFDFLNVFDSFPRAGGADALDSASADDAFVDEFGPPRLPSLPASPLPQDMHHLCQPAPQPLQRATSEPMLDDVARYLAQEPRFQAAVTQMTRQAAGGAGHAAPPPSFNGFMRVVQDYLELFRRSRNISRADFDKAFNRAVARSEQRHPAPARPGIVAHAPRASSSSSSSADAAPWPAQQQHEQQQQQQPPPQRSLLGSAFGAFSSLVGGAHPVDNHHVQQQQQQPAFLPGSARVPNVPNVQGQWRQTEESERVMQELRVAMGTPWILSKMFELMESRFEIELHGAEMTTRLTRRWLPNTTLKFLLDGNVRAWGVALPAPFAQLSQGWTYRAWVDGAHIVISHMIGDQRVMRTYWMGPGRAALHSVVVMEVLDPITGTYQELGRANQVAVPT